MATSLGSDPKHEDWAELRDGYPFRALSQRSSQARI
jgi:hypothetical protein